MRCTAGYVVQKSKEFVPLVMGITRGVKLSDDKTPVSVEVWLDTPLTREVVVTLDQAPVDPSTAQHRRFVRTWLDLEGEGVFLMAEATTNERVRKLPLKRLLAAPRDAQAAALDRLRRYGGR